MKKVTKFMMFAILFFVFILLYLRYDSKGYRYGLECSFCNKDMPYGLTPKIYSDYPQNFVLLDEDGLHLTGSGFRYRQSSFTIKNILSYAYNDTSVVLECTDSLNNIKYLISYETGYKSTKGNPAIAFKEIDNSEYTQIKDSYQWVEFDEGKSNNIGFMKFIFIVGALLSVFFIIRELFKSTKNKGTQ